MANELLRTFFNSHYTDYEYSSKHIQFFVPMKKLPKSLSEQYLHLLATISKLLFAFPKHPRFRQWSVLVFYAKIRTAVASLLVLRRNCKWPFRLVEAFHAHMDDQVTNLDDIAHAHKSRRHFRLVPRVLPDFQEDDDIFFD